MAASAAQKAPTTRGKHLRVVEKTERPTKRKKNKRVKSRPRNWARLRKDVLQTAVDYANAASAHRRALGLTLDEVGKEYGVTGGAVCRWESGLYLTWTDASLQEYQRRCNRLAA